MTQPWRMQQAVRSRALMPVLICRAWTTGHVSGDWGQPGNEHGDCLRGTVRCMCAMDSGCLLLLMMMTMMRDLGYIGLDHDPRPVHFQLDDERDGA